MLKCVMYHILTNICNPQQRIPSELRSNYKTKLPSKLWFICENVCWKGRFNSDVGTLDGLGSFMRFYKLKMYSTIQFDYYGDDLFVVKKFKTNAVEGDCPRNNPKTFTKNKETYDWNLDEYIVGNSTIELEKHTSLWGFNAYWNSADFKKMKISSSDLNRRTSYVVSSKLLPI